MEERALYIICEGQTDAAVLREILDCSRYGKVYMVPAGGYNNLSSVARTIRLMRVGDDNDNRIIVVFDSDSLEPKVKGEKTEMMRYMLNARYDERVEVFCFEPDIDVALFGERRFSSKAIKEGTIRNELASRMDELRSNPVIREIQEFLDR